jgi:hypothetical protein
MTNPNPFIEKHNRNKKGTTAMSITSHKQNICPFTNRRKNAIIESLRHGFNNIAAQRAQAGDKTVFVMPTMYTKEVVGMEVVEVNKSGGYIILRHGKETFALTF